MHHAVRVLAILTAYHALTSVARAQTTAEPPRAPSSAAAVGQVETSQQAAPPMPPTTTGTPWLAPMAPSTPGTAFVPEAPAIAATSSTVLPPVQTVPVALKTRTRDCASEWMRHGAYVRFGSGFGSVNVSGNGPRGAASLSGLGTSSELAIGGNLVGGLVLAGTVQSSNIASTFTGGPFVGETVTSNGKTLIASSKADASSSLLGLLVDWYPNLSNGWHVGLSAGLGVMSVTNHADDSTMTGTSAAGSVFGGYDWAIGPEWSIGLALVASGARSTTLKTSSDQLDTGYRLSSYFVGISGSFLYF